MMRHIHIFVLSTATGLHSAASSTHTVCSLGFTAMCFINATVLQRTRSVQAEVGSVKNIDMF